MKSVEPTVSVVIPTYKRADLLPYVLEALKIQTFKDFDVVVVVKPSGDGTEQILKQQSAYLPIKMVLQSSGHFVDACFLGAKKSTGKIIAFLDDDAVPENNWLEETIGLFNRSGVGAVTGDSISAFLRDGRLEPIEEEEISTVLLPHFEWAWFGRPLKGLEEYKNSIADSGLVYERGNNAYWRRRGAAKALPRGPSMAVLGSFMRNLDFPASDWILGCAWEMLVGWHLHRQGYQALFTPNVRVYHIVHGRTASRDALAPRVDLLWAVEAELLFYRLYGNEPQMSIFKRAKCDFFRACYTLKAMKSNSKFYVGKLKGMFVGNIIGAKWIIYKTIGASYSPLSDLKKLRSRK